MGILELMLALLLAALLGAGLLGASRTLVKAGYSGWWALLVLFPIANLIAISVLGGADWPVLKRLRALEGAASRATTPGAFRRG